MTRRALTLYAAAAALVLGTGPVFAQDPPSDSKAAQSGARPNPGSPSSGSAVSRPSGGGSSGGGGSTTSSSPGSAGGSAVSSPRGGHDGSGGFRAPARPERRPENRAVPRDNMGSPSSSDQRRVGAPGGAVTSGDSAAGRRRAVPTSARPRDGRPTVGTAVQRDFPSRRPGDRDWGYYYDPYYYGGYYSRYPYGYYWPGYGFGLGYFYDPWMWGSSYYDPYYYGGGGGYSTYRRGAYRPVGSIRLKVKPNEGQVFVDGYYVGEVDSFDGIFQRLTIEEGAHRIEIRAPGYEPSQFEVMVIPGETITYKGELKRVQ